MTKELKVQATLATAARRQKKVTPPEKGAWLASYIISLRIHEVHIKSWQRGGGGAIREETIKPPEEEKVQSSNLSNCMTREELDRKARNRNKKGQDEQGG